jgi:hypothetical protein
MVNLEPNALVQMLVLKLTYPKLGVVVAMEQMHAYSPLLLIKFPWERIAVMGLRPAIGIFIIGCSMELQAMLELVKEVGELNCISTFNTAL